MAVGAFITLAIAISTTLKGMSAFDKAGRGWKGIATAIKKVALELMILAAILAVDFIASAVRAFAEFEHVMAGVQAVSGAVGEEFTQLRDKALELARSTMFTATEVGNAMFFMSQAGLDVDEVLGNVGHTLQLAQIGMMDLGKASDILTDIMRGMKLETKDMAHVTDVLAETYANYNTSVEQLGVAMSFAAPLASQLGISIEETAAAIGILSSAGIKGERAGTTVRNILANLIEPSMAAKRVLDELGISVRNQQGDFNTLANIIGQFSVAGATAEQVMQIFQKRAGPGFLALMDQLEGSDRALVDFTAHLIESQGAAKRMADVIEASPIAKFKKFKSKLEEFMIRVGGFFFPVIEKFMNVVFPPDMGGRSPFLEALFATIKDMKPFFTEVVTLVVQLGKVLFALGPVFKVIFVVITAVLSVVNAILAVIRVVVEAIMGIMRGIGAVGGMIGLGGAGMGALGLMASMTGGIGGFANWIGGLQGGGIVRRNSLAFLHAGEMVINPKAGQTINHPGEMTPGQFRSRGGTTMNVVNNFYGQSAASVHNLERGFIRMKRRAQYK